MFVDRDSFAVLRMNKRVMISELLLCHSALVETDHAYRMTTLEPDTAECFRIQRGG
jgi:hypothetical protein